VHAVRELVLLCRHGRSLQFSTGAAREHGRVAHSVAADYVYFAMQREKAILGRLMASFSRCAAGKVFLLAHWGAAQP